MVAEKTPNYVSSQQYLTEEEKAEVRNEYWNGEIVAMSGASRSHNRITRNLNRWFAALLEKSACEPFTTDTRVRIPDCNAYFYPDALIVCGDIEAEVSKVDTILNPIVIVEVVSPSTEAVDRGRKFACYRTLASLRYYVLIEQTTQAIDLYTRHTDGRWLLTILTGPDATLALEVCGVSLPFSAIYQRVEFPLPTSTDEIINSGE